MPFELDGAINRDGVCVGVFTSETEKSKCSCKKRYTAVTTTSTSHEVGSSACVNRLT